MVPRMALPSLKDSDGLVDFLLDSSEFPNQAGMPEVPQQEVATLQSVCEEPAASDEGRRESGEDLGLASPGETPLGVSSLSHNVSEGSIIPGEPDDSTEPRSFDTEPQSVGTGNVGPRVLRFVGPNPQRMPEATPSPPRPRRRLLHVSFAFMSPEQWAALCYLEEEEFEQQMASFTRILDPGDPRDDDAEIPFLLLRATMQNHQWDRHPVVMARDANGHRFPLFEVLQHHDDDGWYADDRAFGDRLVAFTIRDFRTSEVRVVILRLVEQEAQIALPEPGPVDPPQIRAARIRGTTSEASGVPVPLVFLRVLLVHLLLRRRAREMLPQPTLDPLFNPALLNGLLIRPAIPVKPFAQAPH